MRVVKERIKPNTTLNLCTCVYLQHIRTTLVIISSKRASPLKLKTEQTACERYSYASETRETALNSYFHRVGRGSE